MKIAIAADHAGFRLKEHLRDWLRSQGHEVTDFGTGSDASTDYPDYARSVGEQVASGRADRGFLLCYTGAGMSIAANKIPGIRAAVAANDETVQLTRAHNDANVLAIGARFSDAAQAEQYAELFTRTEFEGGRHSRRLQKIAGIEHAFAEEQVKVK